MQINKYNLFINQKFDTYNFINSNNSIFNVIDKNFLENIIYLTLKTKPDNNTDFVTLNIDDIEEFYFFPMSNNNISFNINEILQSEDNNAIFIITNHIESNKFGIKLIWTKDNLPYTIYNNSKFLLYNNLLEDLFTSLNNNKIYLNSQKVSYTSIINSNSLLSDYINNFISISTDYTSLYNINISFIPNTNYNNIISIIDKFYLNVQIYDYNDFKYIYNKDLNNSENNYKLSTNSNITGILKNSNTKIIPHIFLKLKLNSTYNFSNNIINKYTSFEKNYNGEKLLYLFQISIIDKSEIYDISNIIESEYIYIIK